VGNAPGNISKLIERLVARRLLKYLIVNNLLRWLQSAYRPRHSDETAVVKVLADILLAVDSGKLAGLALLDSSAAFDTVDQDVLLQPLQISYGTGGVAWIGCGSAHTCLIASSTSESEQTYRRRH